MNIHFIICACVCFCCTAFNTLQNNCFVSLPVHRLRVHSPVEFFSPFICFIGGGIDEYKITLNNKNQLDVETKISIQTNCSFKINIKSIMYRIFCDSQIFTSKIKSFLIENKKCICMSRKETLKEAGAKISFDSYESTRS